MLLIFHGRTNMVDDLSPLLPPLVCIQQTNTISIIGFLGYFYENNVPWKTHIDEHVQILS